MSTDCGDEGHAFTDMELMRAVFCARHAAESFPVSPHPSHDSQLSRLAIAITIPVTHAAKAENSTRSIRSAPERKFGISVKKRQLQTKYITRRRAGRDQFGSARRA